MKRRWRTGWRHKNATENCRPEPHKRAVSSGASLVPILPGDYDRRMDLLALLAWAAFCGVIAVLSVRGRETLLLALWGVLCLPILASLYRLGFA